MFAYEPGLNRYMSAAVRHLILLPGDFRAVTEKIYNGFLSGIQFCNTGFFIEMIRLLRS